MTKKSLFLLTIALLSHPSNAMEQNDISLKKRKVETQDEDFSPDPLLTAIYEASKKEYERTNTDIAICTSGNYWKAYAAIQDEHNYQKAKIFLKAAAYENDIEALSTLGQCYFDTGNLKKSEAYLRQYITIKLKFTSQQNKELVTMTAFAFYKLGEIYEQQDNIPAALKAYETSGEMEESEGYRNIAKIYQKKKDLKKAETYYWKAMELSNSTAFNELCQLYEQLGDSSKLQDLKAQEQDLFPSDSE